MVHRSPTSLFGLVLTAFCAGVGVGANLRADAGFSTFSAEWSSCRAAEAESRRFWATEWAGLTDQLLKFQSVAAGPANGTSKAATKLAGTPKTATLKAVANKVEHHDPLAGLKLNMSPKSAADLAPALGMLKGVYEDGKERIGQLNVREKASKKAFETTQSLHDQKLAGIAARLKNHSMSKARAATATKDEAHLYNYWARVRELQHRQYHTALKLQHATLMKVKGMIDMYEETISGKKDSKVLAREFAAKAGYVPEVVLLQEAQQAVRQFCQTKLIEVKRALAELKQ